MNLVQFELIVNTYAKKLLIFLCRYMSPLFIMVTNYQRIVVSNSTAPRDKASNQ